MRHRNLRTALRGTSSHRRAMFNNMLAGLVEHGRIKTTEKRAKVLRSIAEKVVTRAASLGDILLKDRSKLQSEDKARVVHAMRMVRRRLKNHQSVIRLFDEVAPRYLGRPGGYTRLYKNGFRKGDGAPMAILEFIDAEMPKREGDAPTAPEGKEKKGRFGWLGKKKADKSAKSEKTA